MAKIVSIAFVILAGAARAQLPDGGSAPKQVIPASPANPLGANAYEPAPIVATPPTTIPLVERSPANDARATAALADATSMLDAFSGSPEATTRVMTNLEAALRLNPQMQATYVEHARLVMKTTGLGPQSLRRSEEWLRKAIEVDPKGGDAYVLLGYVLTHANRLKEAETAFTTAQSLPHSSQWLDANLGELRHKQRRFDEAVELYRRAFRARDERVRSDAARWLAWNLGVRHTDDEAEEAHRFLLSRDPRNANVLYGYGSFLRTNRVNVAQSEAMLRQAIAIRSFDEARKSLGLTMYLRWAEEWAKDKNSARAAQFLNEATRLCPAMSDLTYEVVRYPRAHPIIDAMAARGHNFDRNDTSPSGTTPLEIASSGGNVEIVKALLRNGANPNTQGYRGATGLMHAAEAGHTAVVQLLLSQGADPTLITVEGTDAQAAAVDKGHYPIANLLADAKRRYVRPAAPSDPLFPFRVGYVYRVKKDWKFEPWSGPDGRFTAGETVIFDYTEDLGNYGRLQFHFKGKLPEFQVFTMPKDKVAATWSEYFEEVGPAPRAPK